METRLQKLTQARKDFLRRHQEDIGMLCKMRGRDIERRVEARREKLIWMGVAGVGWVLAGGFIVREVLRPLQRG